MQSENLDCSMLWAQEKQYPFAFKEKQLYLTNCLVKHVLANKQRSFLQSGLVEYDFRNY